MHAAKGPRGSQSSSRRLSQSSLGTRDRSEHVSLRTGLWGGQRLLAWRLREATEQLVRRRERKRRIVSVATRGWRNSPFESARSSEGCQQVLALRLSYHSLTKLRIIAAVSVTMDGRDETRSLMCQPLISVLTQAPDLRLFTTQSSGHSSPRC